MGRVVQYANNAERGTDGLSNGNEGNREESDGGGAQATGRRNSNYSSLRSLLELHTNFSLEDRSRIEDFFDRAVHLFERTKHFLRYNQIGRGISVLLPFAGLILIGAIVVGKIEGWTVIESLYFSVVSLTTVGFGDYYPTREASLSNNNVQRLERTMRRRIKRAKERAKKERAEALERATRAAEQGSVSIQLGGDN
eukprot:507136-Ditylum_brightwellii.AAC.1